MHQTTVRRILLVFSFVLLFFAPLRSGAQVVGADLCTVTIESVKCIKPSTGQDAYTSFLFKGIEIAIQAAVAVGTAGSSLTATVATQIAKEALKKTAKAGLKIAVTNQAKNFYAANKEEIMGLANLGGGGGGGNSSASKLAGVANEVYQLTSLQGIFNKVYGTSPDDLYIKVNGNKIWPSGKYASITSQQQYAVGYSFNIAKYRSFNIQLVEYDYGSGDDDMGVLTFKIPNNFTGTDWIRDQVIHHEEEGSLYMITLRVESHIKHRFINNLAYSGWDIKVDNTPGGVLVFDETKADFLDLPPEGGWKGFIWGINNPDQLNLFNPTNNSYYYLTFNSENSFSGVSRYDNKSTITGTRRASMHRYINNLVGSSWKLVNENGDGDIIYIFEADGTIRYKDPSHGGTSRTWHVTGPDKIKECINNSCVLEYTFISEYKATRKFIDGGIVSSEVNKFPIVRVNSSGQAAQTQNLQHRFITNIVGTSWNFSDPAGGNFSFSFGDDKITNVTPAGTFWDAITWRVFGNDIIELRANNGATMNISFTDQNNFSGNSWYDKNKVVTGSARQVQQPLQSSETLPSRFINKITGTTWNFEDPAGGNVRFTFGQGNFINVSPAGTFWDEVAWKPVGRDVIEVRAKTGAVMEFYFSQNSFVGRSWFNKEVVVSGSPSQSQQQESFSHRFINNLVGSSWNYTESTGSIYTFTFGNGVITNFSTQGTYWDKVSWQVVGTDIIELLGPNDIRMNLIFNDANQFSGTFWNNGTSPISGSRR